MLQVIASLTLLGANPIAIFDTTKGEFSAEIYVDRVPLTSSNFIDLAQTVSTPGPCYVAARIGMATPRYSL